MQVHLVVQLFIDRPIENCEGLRIICGKGNATGSYITSLFLEFEDRSENDDNNNHNDESRQPEPMSVKMVIPTLPHQFQASRPRHHLRGHKIPTWQQKSPSMVSDLITVVGDMAATIKYPTHFTKILYEKVMDAEGLWRICSLMYLIIYSCVKVK